MALQATGIADLVTTTLAELGRLKFTDLGSNYRESFAFKRFINKNKMTFDSGDQVKFNVILDQNHSARAVGLFATDIINVNDVMTTGTVDWRNVTKNWAFDYREPLMNASPAKIVDLIKVRRIASMISVIEFFEERIWRVPLTTDTDNIYGIPYWIAKSATAATYANADGFNGTVPVPSTGTYTTVGGINPTTVPRWCNYSDAYTNVTKDDLIRKMRRAATKTKFKPIVDDIPTYSTGDDYLIATNYQVYGPMEESLEAQNENLGNDLASRDGQVMFRRSPVSYIQELDKDTTNPVYGINFGEFGTMGLRGAWGKETVIPVMANQHTVSSTHTDWTLNTLCRNRRKQWVVSTGTGNIGD